MTISIAGMTYTRRPLAGENITCRCISDGNGIAAVVVANGETIAFDQIALPSKPDKEDSARTKREGLARAAAAHWRAEGFDVTENA